MLVKPSTSLKTQPSPSSNNYKTMKIRLLTTLFLSFSFLASAKEKAPDLTALKHPVKTALWKVEGKGLKKPSYLFGTIHLGDPRVTTLHPNAEKAFKASDHFYAEIDLDPAKQMAMAAKVMRTDGKTLSASIGPKLSKQLNQALKDVNPALDSTPFESMKTWVIGTMIPVLEMQLSGKKALDVVLYERAQKDKKVVGALETADSQLKIFDDLKEEEQVALLKSTLDEIAKEKKAGKNSMKDLLDLYLTGSVPEIGVFMQKMMSKTTEDHKELSEKLIKKIFTDRNISMAETIAKNLAANPESSHFFAVGTGHYTSETAIQTLLEKEGYNITPLFE